MYIQVFNYLMRDINHIFINNLIIHLILIQFLIIFYIFITINLLNNYLVLDVLFPFLPFNT